MSSGLLQRAFLSAARNDGRTGRPRRTAVLRRTRGCLVRHLRNHEDSKECERLPDRDVICSKQANHPGADFHCAEPARDNSVSSRPQKFRRRTFCPGLCFGNPWKFPFRDEWLTAARLPGPQPSASHLLGKSTHAANLCKLRSGLLTATWRYLLNFQLPCYVGVRTAVVRLTILDAG